MNRILTAVLALSLTAPLAAQAPRAGSMALGLGFGFNTAGSLGLEASLRYLATHRLAVGCRVTAGWGSGRACGANVYPFDRREWHLVAELGNVRRRYIDSGVPTARSAWFVNLGAGVEDQVENDQGGHYRDNRVHFIIGPSVVLAERTGELGEAAITRWGVRPHLFNHTELLLYPVLK